MESSALRLGEELPALRGIAGAPPAAPPPPPRASRGASFATWLRTIKAAFFAAAARSASVGRQATTNLFSVCSTPVALNMKSTTESAAPK